jgi:hypothetical protein
MKKFFTLVALAFTAISMSAQESAIYAWQDDFEANNTITFADGAKIQITGNPDKTISKGNKITIDGTEYVSMKVSNGAENTFTAPEGKKVSKATFYSYVNKDAQTDRPAFWKEVAGVTYTVDECGELMCFKDGANPDVRSYTLPEAAGSFTFTNSGEQLCYVLVVEFGDGATPTPPSGGLDIDPALPVTFDSWSASFLIKKTDVKAGDKFIFTGEAIEVADWQWGPQVLPKSNADWSDLGEALSLASGTATYTVTEDYAQVINNNGGLRVQGMGCIVTDVAFEPAGDTPSEDEEIVLIEQELIATGWGNQPNILSDGGAELKNLDAKPGDVIRFYIEPIDPAKQWNLEIFEGHWTQKYAAFSNDISYNEDGSVKEDVQIVDLAATPYVSLELTQEMIDKAYQAGGWGGSFLLNGDNTKCTKVTFKRNTGIADSIATLSTTTLNDSRIYNLSGQVVDKNYKGIVICNGKKFLQK